ncbi:MAG: FAD-dependent oxidoreductase, partial [Candidatus Nanopelagicales bacterium]
MALSSNRRRVVVVGAGISGIACARELADAGLPVQVCDRSDRIGGRMAVRTIEGRAVDVGASYFTVRAAEFS